MLSHRPIALLLLFAIPAGLRADDWPVERGPSWEPAPRHYDPKTVIPKAFLEEAPACVIYSGLTYVMEEDGNVITTAHEITRLNTRKGIDRLGEYRNIYYNPVWQKLTLNEARVIKPDGKTVAVEPRNVQVRDSNTDYLAYDRDKQLVISFPNLQIGDVIEVKWTTTGKNPEYFGQFFTRTTFGDERYPTVEDDLRVRIPTNKQLKYAAINGKVEPVIHDQGATRLYQWTVKDQAELPHEENVPFKETLRLQVACSTFTDWSQVAVWKKKLRAKSWEATAEIKNVVREVTQGLTDPNEKAKALSYWVRKHIRYESESASGAGYTPQLPARTLANLYGDCKDQSQLLATMLKEAGLEPELVTLGVLDDGQVIPEVPMPWGTHAILLLKINGKQHWIDSTATNAAWDFLPREDRDRMTYVVNGSKIRLVKTPPLTAADNRFEATTHINVLADGTSICKRNSVYHGGAAIAQRDAWFEATPLERRRLAVTELQDTDGRAKLHWIKVDESSLSNWNGPVRAETEFEIPGHFGAGESGASLCDGKTWSRLLSFTIDQERQVPLDLGAPFESVHRYVIELPPAYRFDALPREQKVRSKWGRFRLQVVSDAKNPGRLEVVFQTRIDQPVVDPADFAAFRKFHEEVSKTWRTWLNMALAPEPDDIPLLACNFLFRPGDGASALVLAQLLAGEGHGKQGWQVAQVARFLQPENAELWEQTAELAPSLEDVERCYTAMVRQFPDQPKYALELGMVRVQLGDFAGAKTVLESLTKNDSPALKSQAFLELARSSLAQQKPREALELVASARAGADMVQQLQATLVLAEIYEQTGDNEKALQEYRKALKLDSESQVFLAAVVRLELALGNHAEAADHLRRYIQAIGDDPDGLVQAATWYAQLGQTELALDLALRVRGKEGTAKAQRVLGLIYAARGEPAKAAQYFRRADSDPEVLLGLMRCYLEMGELRKAITVCDLCEQLNEIPATLRDTMVTTHRLAERRTGYLEHAPDGDANKKAWADAVDAFLCADLAHCQGKPVAEVEALLAPALKGSVKCAPAYALRGLLLLERGMLSKALSDAEAALAIDSTEPLGYLVRGRIRLERSDKNALADLQEAARLTKRRDGWVLHWLAAALSQAGNHRQALATQGEAALLLPAEPEVREQLRDFEKAGNNGK